MKTIKEYFKLLNSFIDLKIVNNVLYYTVFFWLGITLARFGYNYLTIEFYIITIIFGLTINLIRKEFEK